MTKHERRPTATRILKAFSKREYAEQFLDGTLYMNTVAHFRWNGTDSQRDPLEGASAFVLPGSIPTLPDDLQDMQAHKTAILPAGLSYASICCFFMQMARLGQDGACMESPHAPDNLGGYYVAIDDFPAFVDRIDLATRLHRLHYYCAPVSYWEIEPTPGRERNAHSILLVNREPLDADAVFPQGVPVFPHDVFYKNKKYAPQMEWRIALCRGVRDAAAYPLKVGSLREIAHLVMPDELDAGTRSCASLPHAWITNLEGGNTTRREFFDELYALEPDRFYVAMSVG